MGGDNFTDAVRWSLQAAREEAAALQHNYVGPEHILLGLLDVHETAATTVLANLGISTGDLRASVLSLVQAGSHKQAMGPDLPYTSRAKKVLELAMVEARDLRNGYMGTEHLLLGLLREERSPAAQALTKAGLAADQVRAEVARAIQAPEQPPHPRMARRSELTESPHPMRRATAPNLAKLALLLAATALGVSITALILSLR
jgi:ATP-dependent Clp protease ATP-binding subunit ClpC